MNKSMLVLLVPVILALVFTACGNPEEPTATPRASQPTATASASPTPATSAGINAPDTETPADEVWIAINDPNIGSENGLNSAQALDSLKNWDVAETLFRRGSNDETIPWIATSWEISDDLSMATVKIQQGISFQVVDGNDFGTLTAEDVAFSMNDANNATNPESIHGQAGDFAGLWGEWRAVDNETIKFNFSQYDVTWTDDFANQSGQAFPVFSKRAFDEKGREWVADNIVATGAYQVEDWRRDESVTLVARDDHWKFSPKVNRIRLLAVTEPTQRLSLLRTGQVDAAHLEPKDAARLNVNDFTQTSTEGAVQLGVFFSGNLWEDVYAEGSENAGEELPFKSTFVHDLPWIGSPGKHGEDDLEQAKAIRTAMAMAIDRESVNDTLLSGLGVPVHVEYFSVNHPRWQEKWEYAYDPEGAVDLILQQDPDYQKGSASKDGPLGRSAFEVSIYAGPELGGSSGITGEVTDAVAGFWQEIGLKVFSLKFSYQTFRPTVVGRSNTHPWVTSCDKGRESKPWHFPVGLVQTSLTRGGFGCGFESTEILDLYRRMATAPSVEVATQAADEYVQFVYDQALQPGIVAVPDAYYFNNKKISAWLMDKAASSNINNLWDIELR